jgi:hypothetical protein
MRGTTLKWRVLHSASVVVLLGLAGASVEAQPPDNYDEGYQRQVYQRRAFDWMDKHGNGHKWGHRRSPHWSAPQISSGWVQRPYPYHLDYYKMRYGGSYAPYFGNLYGPPQVVTAPPYYGPYYGGYESAPPNAYIPNGAYPGAPNGVIYEAPVENAAPVDQQAMPPNGENLPAP